MPRFLSAERLPCKEQRDGHFRFTIEVVPEFLHSADQWILVATKAAEPDRYSLQVAHLMVLRVVVRSKNDLLSCVNRGGLEQFRGKIMATQWSGCHP